MNASELSARLADNAASVAQYLLPKGKKSGSEWKVGSLAGEPGSSLSVRLAGPKRGLWADFSTEERGDLLDLWAAARGMSIGEAMRDAKNYLGVRDDMPVRERKTYRRPEKPRCQAPKSKVRQWLLTRGITEATMAAFKIGEQLRDGKAYAVLPYFRDGELVNAKYRNTEDKRDMRQEAGAEPCLFGWHLIDPRARSIVITEGEIDAMTLHQLGFAALSVNQGAGNHQWIESDWDALERFSEILLCFDNDDAGKKGVTEVAQRLGSERCRVVQLGAKDANQWLQDGASEEEFSDAFKRARTLDPSELVSMSSVMDAVKALLYPATDGERDPCLMIGEKAYDWFEFRAGEVSVWTGYNGHGKSLMLNQVLLGLAHQGERVCVFSGEMSPAQQGKRLVKQATGLDRPTPEYIDEVGRWVEDRFWLFNVLGSAKVDRLLEVFGYAARRYGVSQFVIDSLMMTDVPEDGPGSMSAQKAAVQRIADFAKRMAVHVHVVAHPRKGKDETLPPGKLDVAGSSKITDGAENVFTVWSARKDEADPDFDPDKPDACLELHKQRNGDVQHHKLWLYYIRSCMQFCSSSVRRPTTLVPFYGSPSVAVHPGVE